MKVVKYMLLNKEISFHNRTAKNRLVFQPMEGCDGTEAGGIGALTARRYGRFAESGAGILWFEATAVCQEGRANPRQLFLNQQTLPDFQRLLTDIRQKAQKECGFEPLIILQATHSGRYSKPNGTPEPIVAYRNEVYEKGKEALPYQVITDETCRRLPELYAHTASLAAEAGFDGVDVKCCHGYLLNEFLSAYSRKGPYGGSFENRTRLYFDCLDAVKSVLPDTMFVTTRLSAYDGFPYPYGFGSSEQTAIDLTETCAILSELQKKGLELVNITIGNPYLIPHVNRPFVGGPEDGEIGVKRVVDITGQLQKTFPGLKLILSALSYEGTGAVDYAEQCLEEGIASLAGFGRMTFAYPRFFRDFLAAGKLDGNKVCIKCGNCSRLMRAGGVAGCPVRDSEVYLPYFKEFVGK